MKSLKTSEGEHLSTVRNVFVFILVLLVAGCSQTSHQANNSCLVKRGAIDIGSGTSKLVLATVNKCNNTIDHIMFEAHRAIGFKQALQTSKDNKFSPAIINTAIRELNHLMQLAQRENVTNIRAVATSAFRTAANATEAVAIIKNTLKLPIQVITQTDEALFAFNAAMSLAKKNKIIAQKAKDVTVWDIGGGSMQIVKNGEKGQTIYLGKIASVSFKNKVLKDILKRDFDKSPNPLGKKNAIEAMNISRRYANKHAIPLLGKLSKHTIIGVGGVHYYSVKNQVESVFNYYDQGDLLETLLLRSKYDDKRVGGNFAQTDVTNLALVLGHMQSLGIEKVYPVKINMAHGVLITAPLWK
jgi:exopolyphosphatase/guanosine-5'-triphosphate,3'-diphosphate pyrophosphatase